MRRALSAVAYTGLCTVASGLTSSSSLLVSSTTPSQVRGYRHGVPDDLLPEGVVTSVFQSSNVPSERRTVLQEYAVAPLFGSRISALLIGSTLSAREFATKKKHIAAAIEEILDLKEGTITLGETQWLSNAALVRPNTPAYRRDDPRTGRVLATCLVGVYLPAEIDLLDHVELGMQLADAITGANPDARLVNDLGVTYCEFEVPDLKNYQLDELMGKPIDPDAGMAAMDRWMDRIQDQLALWGAAEDGEADNVRASK